MNHMLIYLNIGCFVAVWITLCILISKMPPNSLNSEATKWMISCWCKKYDGTTTCMNFTTTSSSFELSEDDLGVLCENVLRTHSEFEEVKIVAFNKINTQ